jgi:hypothetical protein
MGAGEADRFLHDYLFQLLEWMREAILELLDLMAPSEVEASAASLELLPPFTFG